ncbi:DUF6876 family protein [Cyanobacterium aponinum AL20118]|uniref:DUF6876 domain-containing protein n=1 Tax=Cyanobacterium aponinum AL20115 TaxID=3090662 RepID=A0AAF1C4T6_9CHRO|nr:DUF6876 family protein [Cyanobacterium aponinum]WPF87535.1 hypothetical protein SAY89_12040 [Cyanobacterium aponinum AL20115]
MTTKTPLPTIATNLKHFIGTSQYYKAFEFPNLYWTDGVQYYVTELNAYELLSIIDYYCGHIMNSHLSLLQEKSPELDNKQLSMLKGIQFWSMEQIDNKFSFSCKADSNYPQLFYHEFTIPLIPQKFFCQRYSQRKWVLMLNTEY